MSTGYLKTLKIEHLRGSVVPFTLPFDKDRKLTIVYGENGTGKTTICDAFEFLATGKIGSLDNRGLGRTNRFWHSIGKKAADVSVCLETTTSTCTGRIAKSEVVVQPTADRPRVEILRRSQILALVEANPSDRYKQISRFIDVSGVEASEAALRELIRNLKKSRDTAIAVVQENQTAITQFWEAASKPGTDPITWAEQETTRDRTALQAELDAIVKLRAAHQRLADYPERFATSQQTLATARQAAAATDETLKSHLATAAENAADLLAILEAANNYLAKYPKPKECPLCESAERTADLSERIAQRINQFAAIRQATANKHAADRGVQDAEKHFHALENNFAQNVDEFSAAVSAYTWPNDVSLPSDPCEKNLGSLSTWLTNAKPLADAWATAEAKRREQSQFLATLQKALDTYRTNVQAQKDLDVLLPRLERALEIVEEERRQFTDQTLSAIATEVGRLYEAVHPGEGLNKISLALDPDKRASLDMNASFCGRRDLPPQAYFSQSHLDTLGLCVFLALAALDSPGETILVLDDVLASVDEPHVERLIEMLYAEALKFKHCLITTHYRPWKQKLRWGWLKTGQCHFLELTTWTDSNGLTLTRSLPDVDRLRELLAESPPDSQLVCAKAGVILEAALDFLTLLYECAVPRRASGTYTLGDLLPNVKKKLRDALRVEINNGENPDGSPKYETEQLGPILDELHRIAQARNVFGCHFNAISFDLLDRDAISFGEHVLKLMNALTDPNVGWPRNSKSGSYWSTAGETRRLHPLQQPT